MRVEIISDGTVEGTKVQLENGENLEYIRSVKWEVEAGKPDLATVTLVVTDVKLRINNEYKISK